MGNIRIIFLFQSLLFLISNILKVESSEETELNGDSGCSSKWESGGRCWRYCNGRAGEWCFTTTPCSMDCSRQTKCGNFSCYGTDRDCVTACPRINWTEPGGGITSGCSQLHPEGMCWRYCKNSKNWCFTSTACKWNGRKCKEDLKCSRHSCKWAKSPGCVQYCKEEEEEMTSVNFKALNDKSIEKVLHIFKNCSFLYYYYSGIENSRNSQNSRSVLLYKVLEKLEGYEMLCKIENQSKNKTVSWRHAYFKRQIRKFSPCQFFLTSTETISEMLREIQGVTLEAFESFSEVFMEKVDFVGLILENSEELKFPAEAFLRSFKNPELEGILLLGDELRLYCPLNCKEKTIKIEFLERNAIKSAWKKMHLDMLGSEVLSELVVPVENYFYKKTYSSQICRLFVQERIEEWTDPLLCSFLTSAWKHNLTVLKGGLNSFKNEMIGLFLHNLPSSHYKNSTRLTISSLTVVHNVAFTVIVKDYLDSLVSQRISGMVKPFSWEIWVFLFVASYLASVILSRETLFENLKDFIWIMIGPRIRLVWFNLASLLLGQTSKNLNLKKPSLIAIWFAWNLIAILTSQCYQAGLFSEISFIPEPEIPKNLDDLAGNKIPVTTTLTNTYMWHKCNLDSKNKLENCLTINYIPQLINSMQKILSQKTNFKRLANKIENLKELLRKTELIYLTDLLGEHGFLPKLHFVDFAIKNTVQKADFTGNKAWPEGKPLKLPNRFAYMELEQAVSGISEGFQTFKKDWFISNPITVPELSRNFYATLPGNYFSKIFAGSTIQILESGLFARWRKFELPHYRWESAWHYQWKASEYFGVKLKESPGQIKNRIVNCLDLCQKSKKNHGITKESLSFIPKGVLFFIFIFLIICLAFTTICFVFEVICKNGISWRKMVKGENGLIEMKGYRDWYKTGKKVYVKPLKIKVSSVL